MNANQVLILARKHVNNGAALESSARLCLADAVKLFDEGDHMGAKLQALRSLKFSVGMFHEDFVKANS
jgi:hypothetical protein